MKIAIAGAGALGGRVGSQLFEAGYDVTLIDMWEEHVNKINEDGLEIQTETDTYTIDIPATLPKNIEDSFDLIIVLTKAMQSVEMVKTLEAQGAIREDTALLTMMNGLGHKDRLKKLIKEDHIFLAVTMWTAGLRGPGQILLEGSGSIIMQRADGVDTPLGHEINDIFNKAKLNSQLSDDVFLAIWEKVVVNSVLNPLCTILDKRIGEIAAYSEVDDMIGPLIQEIVDVANSRDVALEYNKSFEKIKASFPDEVAGLHYPSMHQDFSNKRPTEIDYLNGQIARYGEEKGIKTPLNEMITHMVHQLEMKNQ